ncbi:hypothetical protein R6V09_17945 [Streptomyces sp. W16]|uniref:hypothetical protein n=1 Tax=Streptomyces sp. W16 TaxID=3076631 RepID=UPI00295B9D16|nr:hypothetical protein [Streptomyces sp. W16]MDV9171989.1 hypothetical protein [Streptomyces sp. W16]
MLDGAGTLMFAGLGVGSLDLVAGLDLSDGLGFAVSHQHSCRRSEAAGSSCRGGRVLADGSEGERLADRITVFRRGMEVLYRNELVAGAWR